MSTATTNGEIINGISGPMNAPVLEAIRELVAACDPTGAIPASIEEEQTATITSGMYPRLPKILADIAATFQTPRERDIFFLGALPLLAAAMPNVEARYHMKTTNLVLHTVISAPPASGKSVLECAERLGRQIEKHLRLEHEADLATWKADPERDPSDRPIRRRFFIPADASARGVSDALQATGGRGVMLDQEIVTLLGTMKNEWGNLRQFLLKSFDGAPIPLMRKGGDGNDIDRGGLCLSITGTPVAARKLIVSVEDGLFSRLIIYAFDAKMVWVSQEPTDRDTLRDRVTATGADALLGVYSALTSRSEPLYVNLSREWWRLHTELLTEHTEACESDGNGMGSTVMRLGVIVHRIACILAILRRHEERGDLPTIATITVGKVDGEAALSLIGILYGHARAFALSLHPPRKEDRDPFVVDSQVREWQKLLPHRRFTTAEAIDIGTKITPPVTSRTVERWLRSGYVRKERRGVYVPTDICTPVSECRNVGSVGLSEGEILEPVSDLPLRRPHGKVERISAQP